MEWKPIDFQGIVSLDKPLINQLTKYLDEKESQLANAINQTIPEPKQEAVAPVLPNPFVRHRLSESLESLDKKIREMGLQTVVHPPENDWQRVKNELNEALWNYVETLESCVIELFQQLGQLGLEHWRPHLAEALTAIKILLMQRLEECIWTIRRLETLLKSYKKLCVKGKSSFKNYQWPWQWLLDKGLISNLEKTQKFLFFRYKRFMDRFNKYVKLHGKSEESLLKFDEYLVLPRLESSSQEKYKRMYQLLKLWEANKVSRSLPKQEIIRTLRNAISPEQAYALFQEYYKALKNELFLSSRRIKDENSGYQQEFLSKELGKALENCRLETHTLGAAAAKYRDFLLRTDPNPYVRTRWGFTEWIVGPEPHQTKEMLGLVYEIEDLDALFLSLRQSIEKGKTHLESIKIGQYNAEIQRWIHEIGQPLTSDSIMKDYAEKILSHLKELDELGSFSQSTVEFVGNTLSKTMRIDWKYHVLFEIPLFFEIYQMHQGIVGTIEDRQHLNRLNKFNGLIDQIEDWLKIKFVPRHSQEIEHDMNDIKEYLQDFLGTIQRQLNDASLSTGQAKLIIREISQQLMEYRFIFGKFFHHLRQNDLEERSLRNQFLFVDQYFESMDNKIYDFKISLDKKLQN